MLGRAETLTQSEGNKRNMRRTGKTWVDSSIWETQATKDLTPISKQAHAFKRTKRPRIPEVDQRKQPEWGTVKRKTTWQGRKGKRWAEKKADSIEVVYITIKQTEKVGKVSKSTNGHNRTE